MDNYKVSQTESGLYVAQQPHTPERYEQRPSTIDTHQFGEQLLEKHQYGFRKITDFEGNEYIVSEPLSEIDQAVYLEDPNIPTQQEVKHGKVSRILVITPNDGMYIVTSDTLDEAGNKKRYDVAMKDRITELLRTIQKNGRKELSFEIRIDTRANPNLSSSLDIEVDARFQCTPINFKHLSPDDENIFGRILENAKRIDELKKNRTIIPKDFLDKYL